MDFSYIITVNIPFPTARLASTALRVLSVDQELSPLVRRSFSLTTAKFASSSEATVLQTLYEATTNRMLRVAVNGFFESVKVVMAAMRELDVDVTGNEWIGNERDGQETQEEMEVRELNRVQGLTEFGRIG